MVDKVTSDEVSEAPWSRFRHLQGARVLRVEGFPVSVRVRVYRPSQAHDLDFARPDRWLVQSYWTLVDAEQLEWHRRRLYGWRALRASSKHGWKRAGSKGTGWTPAPAHWFKRRSPSTC